LSIRLASYREKYRNFMKPFHLPFVAIALILSPGTAAWGQTTPPPTRAFSEIKLSTVEPKYMLERGVSPGIASGTHVGIYIRFAEDIARMVKNHPVTPPQKALRLNVFATDGAFDSLKRLRTEDEVQLAIVQSDLWYYARKNGPPDGGTVVTNSDEARIQNAWKDIYDNIRLLLPLYQEKIHILVKPKDKTAGTYKDLSDLFKKEARVGIGREGSGGYVTCTLLEEIIARPGQKRWKPSFDDTETALRKLVGKDKTGKDLPGGPSLDAVILVGGVPFPPLVDFGVEHVKEKARNNLVRDLFSAEQVVPQMALLEFGAEADALVEASEFEGYLPTEIDSEDYSFLQKEKVKTRAITACLVTHAKYNDGAGKEAHKIGWVRHILYHILYNLNPNTDTGLVDSYGQPLAGTKWLETARMLRRIYMTPAEQEAELKSGEWTGGVVTWKSFGWELHGDVKKDGLQDILNGWGKQAPVAPSRKPIIDPDRL